MSQEKYRALVGNGNIFIEENETGKVVLKTTPEAVLGLLEACKTAELAFKILYEHKLPKKEVYGKTVLEELRQAIKKAGGE